MTPRKSGAAKPAKTNGGRLGFEATLWSAADKLRNKRSSSRRDLLGRVYEYFLSQFASAEGSKVVSSPPVHVGRAFDELVRPMVETMIVAVHESRTLASLRDSLLPKPLSGDIRVREAARSVEQAL